MHIRVIGTLSVLLLDRGVISGWEKAIISRKLARVRFAETERGKSCAENGSLFYQSRASRPFPQKLRETHYAQTSVGLTHGQKVNRINYEHRTTVVF